MDSQEFLEVFGPPKDNRPIDPSLAERYRDLVPDELVDLWVAHGTGSYASGFYRLCTPDLFHPVLSSLLLAAPTLYGKLHAVGYSAFGIIDLWHEAGRHFSFDIQFASLTDRSSYRESEPPPHDMAELYALAGVEMPDDHEEAARRIAPGQLTVWDELAVGASIETYRNYIGDDEKQLPKEVEHFLGKPQENQMFLLRDAGLPNVAQSYARVDLSDILQHILSRELRLTEFELVNGNRVSRTKLFAMR